MSWLVLYEAYLLEVVAFCHVDTLAHRTGGNIIDIDTGSSILGVDSEEHLAGTPVESGTLREAAAAVVDVSAIEGHACAGLGVKVDDAVVVAIAVNLVGLSGSALAVILGESVVT